MTQPSDLVVGETRIRDGDGFCGTVAYVGPVASAKDANEIYAGIQWDDPSRGKHDGSVISRKTNQLVRHFSCQSATQGSFLKLSKLDTGVALDVALLRSKYVKRDAPLLAPNNILPHTALTSKGHSKAIEFLGELQIREKQQVEELHKISLRREGISRCGDKQDLAEFDHLEEVDLAGNLLPNWSVVFDILDALPNLKHLSLAGNRIRDVPEGILDRPLPGALRNVQVLNLNHCSLQSFRTLRFLSDNLPKLQELYVCGSVLGASIDKSADKKQFFASLRVLDCSSCGIDDWETVSQFSMIPHLERLVLDDNPLSTIPLDLNGFRELKSLQLAKTRFQSWMSLEGLNNLTKLEALRLKNTPLTSQMGQGEARTTIIARFPKLTHVNASVISTKERLEAERRYVTTVTRLLHDQTAEQVSIVEMHPQFAHLKEKHNDMFVSLHGAGAPGSSHTLAASVANLTFRSLAAQSCHMDPLIRRMPTSLTVGRCKALCQRAFGLDVDAMELHFRHQEDAFPQELDDDSRTLEYYGVRDGAEITMNEKDFSSKGASMNDDIDRRIKEQEEALAAKVDLSKQSAGR